MEKMMLVLDNQDDQDFIEKVLIRLGYPVISLGRGANLTEQLIEHFPDVVFASMLGKNVKMLSALGKIKQARGKPLLVFVKQPKESGSLTESQKDLLDGVIYSPIDPFKVIDVLCNIFSLDKVQLRRRYNEKLQEEREANRQKGKGLDPGSDKIEVSGDVGGSSRQSQSSKDTNYGSTDVRGSTSSSDNKVSIKQKKVLSAPFIDEDDSDPEPVTIGEKAKSQEASSSHPPVSERKKQNPSDGDDLVNDQKRREHYANIVKKLDETGPRPEPFDAQVLREKQSAQSAEIKESTEAKKNRKHFLKTLFSISPAEVLKKSE